MIMRNMDRGGRRGLAATVIAALFLGLAVPTTAQTGKSAAGGPAAGTARSGSATDGISASDPLSRGIALYREKRNDEAIIELRRAVEMPGSRTLGYYYAARIRIRQGNLASARKNLLAALADSADFHDATGLLAWTNRELGNTTDALIEWGRFVAAVGAIRPGEPITDASIMLPENYRELLPPPGTRPDTTMVAAADTGRAVVAGADTIRAIGRPDSAAAVASPVLDALDRRIESQIRRGYYGIGAAVALMIVGLGGVAWWLRRRRRIAGPDFLTDVGNAIDAAGEDEFSLDDGEIAARGHRQITRRREEPRFSLPTEEISLPPVEPPSRPARIPAAAFTIPAPEPSTEWGFAGDEEFRPAFRNESSSESGKSGRQPITEEIKALVARMYHEGRSAVEIARLADLTRTEVELILAVRTRVVEDLVRTAVEEDEEPRGAAVHRAVAELAAEGRSALDIARQLGISTSEVRLALAVMEKWKRKKR